jgi:hypothetical protein
MSIVFESQIDLVRPGPLRRLIIIKLTYQDMAGGVFWLARHITMAPPSRIDGIISLLTY